MYQTTASLYESYTVAKRYLSNQNKSNLHYTRLIPFRMSGVSGAQLHGFPPVPTHQGCSGGESLATC